MADIASITFSAISVTQKASVAVYKFVRGCKEACADLAGIARQLTELTLVLGLIKDGSDIASENLPKGLQDQVKTILGSCEALVKDIETIVASCNRRTGPLRWTLVEKDKVKERSISLEAFKCALSLALDTVNLSVALLSFLRRSRN